MDTPTSPLNHPIERLSVRVAFVLITVALTSVGRAVTPAPDGDYPNANTAEGHNALFDLSSSGFGNTALGSNALFSNTTGSSNTATGNGALFSNIDGSDNTATGVEALTNNTTTNAASGHDNTATGASALHGNIIGANNTANGASALYSNEKAATTRPQVLKRSHPATPMTTRLPGH